MERQEATDDYEKAWERVGAKLVASRKEMDEAKAKFKEELSNRDHTNEALQAQLLQLSNELAAANEIGASPLISLQQLTSDVDKFNLVLEEINNQLEKKEQDLQKKNQQISTLSDDEELEDKFATLEEKRAGLEAEISDLTAKKAAIQDFRGKAVAILKILDQYKKEHEQLETARVAAREAMPELEHVVKRLRALPRVLPKVLKLDQDGVGRVSLARDDVDEVDPDDDNKNNNSFRYVQLSTVCPDAFVLST